MKILVVADRMGPDGALFRMATILPHSPVTFTPGVPGWQGEGSGISAADFEAVIESLGACNIHRLTVELMEIET